MDASELITNAVRNYGDAVLHICYIYLKDYHLAEDVAQETFIRVYRAYLKTGDIQKLNKAYISKTAINLCKNQIRTKWFQNVIPVSSFKSCSPMGCEDADDRNGAILEEIMKLRPKYKEVVLLFYYQELSISEIAECLKLTESAVKVRLMRARKQLSISLGDYKDESY